MVAGAGVSRRERFERDVFRANARVDGGADRDRFAFGHVQHHLADGHLDHAVRRIRPRAPAGPPRCRATPRSSASAGRLNTSLTGPTWRTRPPMTTATVSPRASASVRSCVTRIAGVPVVCRRARTSRRSRTRVGASSDGERLVEQEEPGVRRQRPCERDALPFAAGQGPRIAIFEILDPQHLRNSCHGQIRVRSRSDPVAGRGSDLGLTLRS